MNNTNIIEILYIEDDEGLWSLVEHKLSKRRVKLIGAATIASARKRLQEKDYALVLIDHELPDGTGYELLQTIHDKFPCIMLTGVGSEELAVQCLKNGARDYIVKDVKGNYLDMLPNIVTHALHETKLENDNKQQANILLKTQERLRAVFDNAPDLLIIADKFFNVLDVSAITIEDYHATRDKIQGSSLNDILTSETLQHLQEHQHAEFKTQLFDDIPVLLRYKHLDSGDNLLVFRNLTDQLNNQKTLEKLHDVEQQNIALSQVNTKLKNVLNLKDNQKILGHSQPMYNIEKVIDSVAPTSATVLINGETGTGKELIANSIFIKSERSNQSYVTLNCASIPKDLVESELFGHEKGAFTGALKNYTGKFVQANQGTLFLDEVGELDLNTQAKILRVLQEGEVQPIGSENTKHVDVRIITATNRNLEEMVSRGDFRADLYYRLNVVPINVPPLRDRPEDIQLLAEFFLNRYKKLYSIEERILESNIVERLESYPWPGNVRELQNVIERFVVLGHIPTLDIPGFYEKKAIQDIITHRQTDIDAPTSIGSASDNDNLMSLADVEKKHILHVLETCKWVISGNKGAAQKLKLNPSTLRFRMQKLNITRD